MSFDKINVGVIGTGNHGSRYVKHIVNDLKKQFYLQGISRSSSDKGIAQAREFNTEFFPNFTELIASPTIDAVISVTPPYLNKQIADTCLSHNKKLLLEKPLATTMEDAQHIVDTFKESKLALTIGQTLRYNNVIQTLKKEFVRIGVPHAFSATHRLEPSSIPWLTDPKQAGAGVIFHTAVHLFDALRYITGLEVKRVHASSFKLYNPNLEDLVTAQIEMDNGMVGIIESSKVTPARSARYEFTGSLGQLQGDQIHGFVQFLRGMGTTEIYRGPSSPAILPLLRDWHLFLTGKGDNPISGEDGLAAVKICDACRKSAKLQQWVTMA
nr:Gfo/Idh/MocA family oxidoreductase [Desulfobulbaceae bacterium]